MPIRFFCADIQFSVEKPQKTKRWINESITKESKRAKEISYVFCSDQFLLDLNIQFLKHDTFTDIITFDFSDDKGLSGEIYISIERILENATKYDTDFQNELRRVMIHGILHLCGYRDKKSNEKKLIRKKEDHYLSLWRKVSRETVR